MRFSNDEQLILLELARETITKVCAGQLLPALSNQLPERLLEADGSGAFVSLHIHHRLRGCIGLMESNLSIADTVRRMAKAAAMDDPRFPKVNITELEKITIEISILSPKRLVNDVNEIELGRDGILIEGRGHSGVFLPQVAEEAGWDLETFLDECCEQKAGLPRKAWQQKDIKLFAFSAEIFSEQA